MGYAWVIVMVLLVGCCVGGIAGWLASGRREEVGGLAIDAAIGAIGSAAGALLCAATGLLSFFEFAAGHRIGSAVRGFPLTTGIRWRK